MDATRRRRQGRSVAASIVIVGAIALAGCSSDAGSNVGSTRETSATRESTATTPTTAPAADDTAALCAIFGRLAASGAGPGAQFDESTPEGWDRRIATTGEIVAAAPAEWRDEAETYLQMVTDRAQLAAENGYVGVDDLPADVRTAFITSHRAMQAEVNALVAFMGAECGVRRG